MMNQKSFTFHPRYKPKAEQAFGFFFSFSMRYFMLESSIRGGERLASEKVLQNIQE